eukprot:TRINITY_DN66802_c0_g1_i1.p1 TRINITY_DN66802_c0_g1~~TRINITY_DN66802_c0_g1_i1.p1  ORF type:complete len:238 (-),score=53.56 TRINITY_DN66802_c0_g1_i1:254-967(-)
MVSGVRTFESCYLLRGHWDAQKTSESKTPRLRGGEQSAYFAQWLPLLPVPDALGSKALLCRASTFHGQACCAMVPLSWSIMDLKILFAQELAVPCYQQVLIYAGRSLGNGELLSDVFLEKYFVDILVECVDIPECLHPKIVKNAWQAFLVTSQDGGEMIQRHSLKSFMRLLGWLAPADRLEEDFIAGKRDSVLDFAALLVLLAKWKTSFEAIDDLAEEVVQRGIQEEDRTPSIALRS